MLLHCRAVSSPPIFLPAKTIPLRQIKYTTDKHGCQCLLPTIVQTLPLHNQKRLAVALQAFSSPLTVAFKNALSHIFFKSGHSDMMHSWSYPCNALYSSSVTASSHSLDVFSPGISTAICENQLFFFAPCQCLTFAKISTTSPGFRLRAGFPHS